MAAPQARGNVLAVLGTRTDWGGELGGGDWGLRGFPALVPRVAPPLLCLSRPPWLAAYGLKVIPPWTGVLGQASLLQGGGQMLSYVGYV